MSCLILEGCKQSKTFHLALKFRIYLLRQEGKGEHQSRVAYLENMRLLCLCISVEVPWQFPEEETTMPREVNKFVCLLKIFFLILHCKFFSRRCTTTTWKCLISRFVEDWNTKQQFSFSFPDFLYNPLKFNSKEICQHLTNSTRWNKRDKVWRSAERHSLFKWRFRGRRSGRCLSSLKLTRPSSLFRLFVFFVKEYYWIWLPLRLRGCSNLYVA